ncbi:TolC family protein [Anseongella ginsenosidimutans]|nr:TolC family protein [Anseongella ginsenosidimutans]
MSQPAGLTNVPMTRGQQLSGPADGQQPSRPGTRQQPSGPADGPLTLEECHALARENYPLIKKLDLISKSSTYSLANASRLYLPQLSISGQASYQSGTVNFSDALGGALPPGVSVPSLSKDQYKITAEVNQTLYDGGAISNRRAAIKAGDALEKQQVEVALHALNERVNQVYFSILLMEEQLRQNETRKADLESSAQKVAAALKYGTAFLSNLDEIKAEIINANMASIQFHSNRKAYLHMLGLLIDRELGDSTRLTMPAAAVPEPVINRPELELYQLQKDLLEVEEKKLRTAYRPKLSAFFQGAYGRPTLNFIADDFSPWYITGARLTWNFGSLYTLKNDKRNLEIRRKTIDLEKETFLLNTHLSMRQENEEIRKYRELIAEDEKAIKLRASVRKAAEAQLENGVITTHDYINQLNAENLARQTLILHKIRLLQAQYNYRHTTGN